RVDVEVAGDDTAAFGPSRFWQAPFHLEGRALMDGDRELRRAELHARVGLQPATADADPAMGHPFGIGQPGRRRFGAEVDQFYLSSGPRIRHPMAPHPNARRGWHPNVEYPYDYLALPPLVGSRHT